ncbi:MAG: Mur ligase family protein [Gammaproteobacteria bacterium]
MELLDSRRLTGPNILGLRPAAIIDVSLDPGELDSFVEIWRELAAKMLNLVGWDSSILLERRLEDGVSLGFTAPLDALYGATEINDWAYAETAARLGTGSRTDLTLESSRLRQLIEAEANPKLVDLHDAALAHGVPFLADDDFFSLGFGARSRTWAVAHLPHPTQLAWEEFGSIPVGLVTGTNGKTTTVRLAASIAEAAGLKAGYCCTDGVFAAGEIRNTGDYSGPGGARAVLRDPSVQCAILETARGGLLRRGTAMTHADAALITNIAADHLEDFGVHDLERLTDIKWLVTSLLGTRGIAVLNADDPRLRARAASLTCPLIWFSMDASSAVLTAHLENGGLAWVLDEQHLVRLDGHQQTAVLHAAEIPITLRGAARHNIANSLAAAALADALGLPLDAIANGLRGFTDDANPGRANLFQIGGARVLLDFAHNPDGVRALTDIANHLGNGRRLLLLGQAGDRGDDSIRELARAAWTLSPDKVIIKELANYARGRKPGEVAAILRESLIAEGAEATALDYQVEEAVAVSKALAWLEPGDLAILLVHEDIEGVRKRLQRAEAGRPSGMLTDFSDS